MTNQQLAEARGWIYDCFEDAPADLSDREVTSAIARHYAGGVQQFSRDTAELVAPGRYASGEVVL